ncbi:MAG: hypothetical protein JWR69_3616 [Pedosphaera sp.]|nr:hypothetical protein [Pedosphaera sp.]
MMSLRILLLHRKSLLYLKGISDWTPNTREARDFNDVGQAFNFVRAAKLAELDILMHFEDPKYDIRLLASP